MVQVQTEIEPASLVTAIASIFDRDPDHSARVTEFSLAIFEDLYPLHSYSPAERRLLEMASLMHDIGYSKPEQKPHNKISRDLILKMNIPGMSDLDKLTFALVTQFHTGELPDANEHRHFSELPEERKEVVEWLAGILRVADALDHQHLNVVNRVNAEIGKQHIVFSLDANANCQKQIKRAHEKEELLVKKSRKAIKYRC
jgi:exopolyphosphatase/guanosine-5'-triphosphate,3'-diphosphate pyrophosphatase